MNPFLFLGPIGMILVGLISIIYWTKSKKTNFMLYVWGGILWFISILLKAVIDFTFSPYFFDYVNAFIPSFLILIACLFVGFRTGFFESGISYFILKSKLKKYSFNDAVALGIGFGATESIILGALSLISMILFLSPAFSAGLSEAQKNIVELSLNQSTLYAFAPVIERIFTMLAHVFATVLIVKSLISKDLRYLWMSILYKFILDFPIPYFQSIMTGDLLTTYLVELYIVFVGLFGYYYLKKFSLLKDFSHKLKKSREDN